MVPNATSVSRPYSHAEARTQTRELGTEGREKRETSFLNEIPQVGQKRYKNKSVILMIVVRIVMIMMVCVTVIYQ